MSGLPIESKYASHPEEPIHEADRDDLTKRLNDAYTRGALDLERYQNLMDGLYTAEHQGQLVPLVQYLPANYRVDGPVGAVESPRVAPGVLPPRGAGLDVRGSYQAMKPWYWVAGGTVLLVLAIVLMILI